MAQLSLTMSGGPTGGWVQFTVKSKIGVKVSIFVDGVEVMSFVPMTSATTVFKLFLTPGRHQIEAHTADGKSESVTVNVPVATLSKSAVKKRPRKKVTVK